MKRTFLASFFGTKKKISVEVRMPVDGIRKASRKKTSYVFRVPKKIKLFSTLAVFVVAVLFFAFRVRADAVLTPRICLGSWSNPSHAVGTPENTDVDTPLYTYDNSATVGDESGDIFCGDFSGDIVSGTRPTALTARLYWSFVPQTDTAVVNLSPDSLASSTSNVLDAPRDAVGGSLPASNTNDSSAGAPATPTPSGDTSHADTSETPQPPSDSTPPPIDSPTPAPSDSAPQSVIPKLLTFLATPVYADELATTSSSTNASVTDSLSENALVEVSYSFSGDSWVVLGTRTRSELTDSSFVIPVSTSTSWSDVTHMQIRVRSLSRISDFGTIYLDGVTLTAQYTSDVEQISATEKTEHEQELMRTLPDANLTLYSLLSSGDVFTGEAAVVDDSKAGIRFTSKHDGNLMIYRGAAHTVFMQSGMGNQPLSMPLYFFPPDSYTAILVSDAAECDQTLPLETCMAAKTYLGSVVFTVSFDKHTSVSSPPQ